MVVQVELPSPPKKGRCDACGKSVGHGIKVTQLHHFCYAFKKKFVKLHPEAALKNTGELDFACHRIGNALMNLMQLRKENMGAIVNVARLMPEDLKLKLDEFCSQWFAYRRSEKKRSQSQS